MDAIFANPKGASSGVPSAAAHSPSNGELETEVRFRIGSDQFQDIARRIEPTDLELSFSIVDAGSSKPARPARGERGDSYKAVQRPNRIRRIIFEGSKAVGDSYMTKEQLFNEDYRCGGQRAKLTVSRETPIGRFDVPSWSIVRAKVRVSTVRGRWRVDLTAVIQAPYSTLGGGLKTMRDEIFGGIHTPADVAKLSDQRFKYEAEIEFMSGDDPRPYFGDLEAICDELFGGAGNAGSSNSGQPVSLMRDIAKIIGQRGSTIKQLGNQVTAVTRATWGEIYPPVGWFASVKYDGKRAFYYAQGATASVITAEGVIEWSRGAESPHPSCLADGEWMADEGVMYLFDCMMNDDKPVVDAPYTVRRALIDGCVAADTSAKCLAKQFVELGDDWRDQLTAVWQAACGEDQQPSKIQPEGLIFTSREGGYSDCRSLKWKPVEHNSIDFLALKCSAVLLGTAPYMPLAGHTLYILFCGISESARKSYGITMLPRYETMVREDGSYFPIQFAPSVQPLAHMWYVPDGTIESPHGKIVELRWDLGTANWQFMRFRTDRESERGYFGNDFRVAEITFLNYIDVVKFDDLLNPPSTYFANDASTAYKPANAFKRIVIGGALRTYFTDEESVLDAMSGRGADMFRYGTIGVRRLLMMELDATAVAEAVRRKLEPRLKGRDTQQKFGIQIAAAVADMRLPAADLVSLAADRGFAQGSCGIVCNFAIHYMCDSLESIVNFMKFAAQMCRPGGHFMFTTFSGSRIVEALKGRPQGEVVEWPESGVVKYAIGKLYAGDTLSQWGQMISVKLPFVAEMREEPLANIDAICAIADRVGFTKVVEKSFGEFDSSTLSMKLSDVDKEYIALHTLVVLRRRKDGAKKV